MGPFSLRRSAVAASVLAAVVGWGHGAAASDYELGRGLGLFDDRLTIGGYLAVDATFLDQTPDRLLIDDLSTFVTLRMGEQWLVFAEGEVEDPVHVGKDGFGSGENIFSLERLYLQWQGGDRFRVRVGKMLTPIGIWNEIHAQPLVWTTSRPITTEQFFDTGLTGAEATVFVPIRGYELTATAFGQATDHLDDPNDTQEFRDAYGTRFQLTPPSGPRLGAAFVRFHDHTDDRMETTAAADAMWSTRLLEISSEFAANCPDSGATTWGIYLQGVWHGPWHLHPFVRVEYADLGGFDRVPVVFGTAWKPWDAVVFKIEGIVGAHDTSLDGDGVLTSFSVLF